MCIYISRLRLFAVDGEENPKARADFIQHQITTCHGFLTHVRPWEVIAKVASYHFKRFPILGAAFTPTGDQAVPQHCVSKNPAKKQPFARQRLQNLVKTIKYSILVCHEVLMTSTTSQIWGQRLWRCNCACMSSWAFSLRACPRWELCVGIVFLTQIYLEPAFQFVLWLCKFDSIHPFSVVDI